MSDTITTVICARNAASTVARAVTSACEQGGPVILVDDGSTDDTVALARAAGGARLEVVRPSEHRTLGFARQAGVDAVNTPWLMWLDADDELLPGRGSALLAHATANGCDAVWDAAELRDGATGRLIRNLPMPPFMERPGAAVRLFERNFTPGPAWPLVRSEVARAVGYDGALPTGDDLDFMLRAQCAGWRLGFSGRCGYRQYAYASSLSRDLAHQRGWVAHVLRKHEYADVRARFRAAGFGARVTAWGLVSMALFRNEPTAALAFVDEASPPGSRADEILEPDGPWPFREGWRRAFQRGTCLILIGGRDAEAAAELQRAESLEPTAEGANNLGVALARLGRGAEAALCWEAAGRRFPGYLDASRNLKDPGNNYITTHPLRRIASRSEY